MRPHFRAAAWVLFAALCGACGSRPLPNNAAGSTAGSTGGGTGAVVGAAGSAGLGGADVTTGGAGAGGIAGAAGASAGMPDCPPAVATGKQCPAVGSACRSTLCSACSDQYWRLISLQLLCVCNPTGVWMCPPASPGGGPIGDCFFDEPLDCAFAQLVYEDANCQTHPPCTP
jgi:hypothetical protein